MAVRLNAKCSVVVGLPASCLDCLLQTPTNPRPVDGRRLRSRLLGRYTHFYKQSNNNHVINKLLNDIFHHLPPPRIYGQRNAVHSEPIGKGRWGEGEANAIKRARLLGGNLFPIGRASQPEEWGILNGEEYFCLFLGRPLGGSTEISVIGFQFNRLLLLVQWFFTGNVRHLSIHKRTTV